MGRTNHPEATAEVVTLDTGVRLNDREAFIVWAALRDLKLRAGLSPIEWEIHDKCAVRARAFTDRVGEATAYREAEREAE